jgi:hypothetical protein
MAQRDVSEAGTEARGTSVASSAQSGVPMARRACSPFDQGASTSTLYFHRINLFDADIKIGGGQSAGTSLIDKLRGEFNTRIGIPLTDLFPAALAERPAAEARHAARAVPQEKERSWRVVEGIGLPGKGPSRHLKDATTLSLGTWNLAKEGGTFKLLHDVAGKAGRIERMGGMTLRPETIVSPAAPAGRQAHRTANRSAPSVATLPLKEKLARQQVRLPRYEIGFVAEYEQQWTWTHNSLGALLSSLSLGPEEEITIEVFSWDRRRIEQSESTETTTEQTTETSSLSRVAQQLVNELSESTDKNAEVGLGVPLPEVPVTIDGSMGISQNIQSSVNSTLDTITENTVKASEKFKNTTQVKVTQARETGTETRTTRKLKNPNRGRTLNFNCYEVLEHYEVRTTLRRADKMVLLVEVPQPPVFDIESVLAAEDSLRRALLSPVFAGGFEDARKLLAHGIFEVSVAKAEQEAAIAKARSETAAPTAPLVSIAKSLAKKLKRCRSTDIGTQLQSYADNVFNPGGIPEDVKTEGEGILGIHNFWFKFRTVTPGIDERAKLLIEAVDGAGNLTEAKAYDALSEFVTGLDDEWLTTIKMVAAAVVCAHISATLLPIFPWLAPILLTLAFIEDNLGVPALIERAKQHVRKYEAKANVPAAASGDEPGKRHISPPQLYSPRELAKIEAGFKALQLHLERNRIYYCNRLFADTDSEERYEMLRALGVGKVIENRLLGFIGRRAIFPLIKENLEDEQQEFLSNLQRDAVAGAKEAREQQFSKQPMLISLPTNGFHLEPVVGTCEALEDFLVESRKRELLKRDLELAQMEAAIAQQKLETARLQARLDANPPLLDDPYSPDDEG